MVIKDKSPDQKILFSPHPNPLSNGIENSLLDSQLEAIKGRLKVEYESSISEHFNDLDDPRKSGMIKHKLND